MKKLSVLIIAWLALLIPAFGQGQNFPPGTTFVYIGVLASIPARCTVGQVAFITNATAGQNLYYCTSANTFTQQLNSGGGTPGGSSGQVQYNNSSAFGGFTLAGDCTLSVPNITCTKANGAPAVATSGSPLSSYCAYFTSAILITGTINCTLDSSGNMILAAVLNAAAVTTGTAPSGISGSASGGFGCTEAAATGWTPTSGTDYIRCDSTAHWPLVSANASTPEPIAGVNGSITNTHCAKFVSATEIEDSGGTCGGGSGVSYRTVGGGPIGTVASWGAGTSNCSPYLIDFGAAGACVYGTEPSGEAILGAGTVSGFFVHLTVAMGAASSYTFLVYKNGSATSMTCAITATNTDCNDTTHTFTIVDTDTVAFTVVGTGGALPNAAASEVFKLTN